VRGRLTAALVAVSLLTLGVAVLAMLLPLDRSLRIGAQRALNQSANEARASFEDLLQRNVRPGDPELVDAVRALGRHIAADVAVVRLDGAVLAATRNQTPDELIGVGPSLRHHGRVSGPSGPNEIETAIRLRAGRRYFGLVLRRPLTELTSIKTTLRRALLLAGGLGLVAAIAAGAILAGRLVRRLTALRDAMADAPDLSSTPGRLVDHGRDEIGDLSRSFAGLRRRIQEQEEARRRFVATASHELRTPLSSLQLILESVGEDLEGDTPDLGDARQQIDRARRQSERLVKLAAELLDLSHIDAGVPLRSEPVELAEIARSVLAEFRLRDGGEAALTAPEGCWASADPGAVARCVRILVDNALRYGAAAEVKVGVDNGRASIAVADHGPGIPDAEAEQIFERFNRGSAAREATGFGLGLAIGRELARAMGGDLLLDGQWPDGACFVLSLPRAAT
jgi:signal transduction histidine kinase